jgi:methyl-accepting chemotaxis protein
LSARTGELIQQLGEALGRSAWVATQMVAGGQQQTSGIGQIALTMGNINQATVQSLASTRQAEKAARDLNDLTQSLIVLGEQNRVAVPPQIRVRIRIASAVNYLTKEAMGVIINSDS